MSKSFDKEHQKSPDKDERKQRDKTDSSLSDRQGDGKKHEKYQEEPMQNKKIEKIERQVNDNVDDS